MEFVDWICRDCGKTIDADFAINFRNCPSLTGCGSTNIRRKNGFDDLRPHEMAEILEEILDRLTQLEVTR